MVSRTKEKKRTGALTAKTNSAIKKRRSATPASHDKASGVRCLRLKEGREERRGKKRESPREKNPKKVGGKKRGGSPLPHRTLADRNYGSARQGTSRRK